MTLRMRPVRTYIRLCQSGPTRTSVRRGHRQQPSQLSHVLRRELLEAADSEQFHGAGQLAGQDFDGTADAGLATGHQPVQVGPADEGATRTESDRGDDVGAGHDAGVDEDLGVGAELTCDDRQR